MSGMGLSPNNSGGVEYWEGGHGCQVWVYPPTKAEGCRIGREDTDVRYGFIPQQ